MGRRKFYFVANAGRACESMAEKAADVLSGTKAETLGELRKGAERVEQFSAKIPEGTTVRICVHCENGKNRGPATMPAIVTYLTAPGAVDAVRELEKHATACITLPHVLAPLNDPRNFFKSRLLLNAGQRQSRSDHDRAQKPSGEAQSTRAAAAISAGRDSPQGASFTGVPAAGAPA